MKELFNETWKDYWQNIFNPNAPITRDNYMRERWFTTLIMLPLMLIGIYYMQQLTGYSDGYIKMSEHERVLHDYRVHFKWGLTFLLLMLVFFILRYSLEMRMFKNRGISPKLFQWAHGLFFVLGLVYVIIAYITGHDVVLFYLVLGYGLAVFSTGRNEFSKREDNSSL